MKPDGEGSRTVVWDGRNAQGQYLPPGNYVAFAYSYNWDDFESFSIALPPVVATPTPLPTASPTDQSEPCEDAQALFPSQLVTPINVAQNLLQPISDPAPMQQNLGDWQKLLKKLKDRQAKIAAEQLKARPNQTKISQWQGDIAQAQGEATQLQTQMLHRVSQMDSARPALRSALNSVAQQPDFSQDAHADVQAHPLPQTLAEYREAIASLVDEFELRVSSENTYDLMAATSTLADEQELYGHLVRDILSEKLPLTPEEPDEDPTDEPLEQINTPRKLVRWLGKRMVNQATKLQNKQQQLNQKITIDAEELKTTVLESQELLQHVIFLAMFDLKMIDPVTLEIQMPQSSFSIQQYEPISSFSEMLEAAGTLGNVLKQAQRPHMEAVAKYLTGFNDAQWEELKRFDPQATKALVDSFMTVTAPVIPQEVIDFIPVGKAVGKGAELTIATGIILSKNSEAVLNSLIKKYGLSTNPKYQQIAQRANKLLEKRNKLIASIKRFCGEANCFSIPLKNVKFPFEKRFPNGGRLYSAKKPTQEEFDFGLELAAQGKKVEIRGAKLEQGPDFVIDGELWELKTITGNTLTERIDDTVKQVGRYNSQLVQQNQTTIPVRGYIDVRKTLLSEEDVKNQVIRSSLNADPKRFSGLKNPPLGTEIRIIIPGGKVIVWPWE